MRALLVSLLALAPALVQAGAGSLGSDRGIVNESGSPISSVLAFGKRYFNTNTIQQVLVSTANSTTANLFAGASFTGTGEEVITSASVQVQIKSDQPMAVEYQQSIDNVNWDMIDYASFLANVVDGRTLQIVGTYFRLKVTNIGSSASTFLRVQTIYTPIMEALPRSLGQKNSEGSLPVVLASDQDSLVPTYSTSSFNNTPALLPTDICTLTGASGKVINIKRIYFTASQTNTSLENILVMKRSSANSGGTSVSSGGIPHDSMNSFGVVTPAASATFRVYGTNPTLGNSLGIILAAKRLIIATAPLATASEMSQDPLYEHSRADQDLTLRSASELVSINLAGITLAGGLFNCSFEWTEENP